MVNNTSRTLNNTSKGASALRESLVALTESLELIERNLENSLRQTKNDDVALKAVLRYETRKDKIIDSVVKSVYPNYINSESQQ